MTEANAQLRLLVVDDDQLVGETICRMARREEFEARFTCDPNRFLELVDGWLPDAVAIDLVMPEVDGVEVLRRLAKKRSSVGIILTSGVAHRVLDAARRSAHEHGLNILGVLPKPFRQADLSELLLACRMSDRGPAPAADERITDDWRVNESVLSQALEQRQFLPYYQPKLRCDDHSLAGFEMLARWQHPRHGLIPPVRFIDLAEATGQIVELSELVIDRALDWFAMLRGRIPPLHLSVNLSARLLEHASMLDRVLQRCHELGVAPASLVLELTETSAMSDPTGSLELLTRLRMRGFQLSIDDFGTGYSSMVQLVRLPFSEMKVDKSFVQAARESQEARSVVESVIGLGRSLGLQTVAEGVEDEWTLDYVCSLNCDLVQGYLLGRPDTGERIKTRWDL